MNLLMHNILFSRYLRGLVVRYPLILKATEVVDDTKYFCRRALIRILRHLDWESFRQAAENIGCTDIPPTLPPGFQRDEEFLDKIYHVLLEKEVVTGELICPEQGQTFKVEHGIAKICEINPNFRYWEEVENLCVFELEMCVQGKLLRR